jgi:hypothetical protein
MKPVVTLLGINGTIGQGKSQFWQSAVRLFPSYRVRQLKFAQPVYDGLYAMNPLVIFADGTIERLQYLVTRVGWEAAKEVPEVRRLLQTYGTEAGREIHGAYCWVKLFNDKLKLALWDQNLDKHQIIINDDLRFPEEFEPIYGNGGVTVKLFGPNRRSHTTEAAKHSSENRLPNEYFDYLLYNTGTLDEYQEHIKTILTSPKPKTTVILGSPE